MLTLISINFFNKLVYLYLLCYGSSTQNPDQTLGIPKSQSEDLWGQIYFHNNPGSYVSFSFSCSHKYVTEFSSVSEASMELSFWGFLVCVCVYLWLKISPF